MQTEEGVSSGGFSTVIQVKPARNTSGEPASFNNRVNSSKFSSGTWSLSSSYVDLSISQQSLVSKIVRIPRTVFFLNLIHCSAFSCVCSSCTDTHTLEICHVFWPDKVARQLHV